MTIEFSGSRSDRSEYFDRFLNSARINLMEEEETVMVKTMGSPKVLALSGADQKTLEVAISLRLAQKREAFLGDIEQVVVAGENLSNEEIGKIYSEKINKLMKEIEEVITLTLSEYVDVEV